MKKKDITYQLNENIKDELTKQINFLQKGILNIEEQKVKRELDQNSEIYKKTKENAEFCDLSAKIKKYEQLVRERNNLTKVNQLLNNNMKINELSNINEDIIKRNISYDKYNFNDISNETKFTFN